MQCFIYSFMYCRLPAQAASAFLEDLSGSDCSIGLSLTFTNNKGGRWDIVLGFKSLMERELFQKSLRDGPLKHWAGYFRATDTKKQNRQK